MESLLSIRNISNSRLLQCKPPPSTGVTQFVQLIPNEKKWKKKKKKKTTISKVKLETKFTHFLWDQESVHSTKYTFIELSVNTQFELCKTVNSG